MTARGWIYVMVNRAMPGLVKVGYSMKDPVIRAKDFEGSGVPHPFIVAYEALLPSPRKIEQLVHRELQSRREAKEWFKCDPSVAIAAVQRAASGTIILERSLTANEPASSDSPQSVHRSGFAGAERFLTCNTCAHKWAIPKDQHMDGLCPKCGWHIAHRHA